MTEKDPKRYRKDVELHQAWRLDRISPTFANEIYDRITELEAERDATRKQTAELVEAVKWAKAAWRQPDLSVRAAALQRVFILVQQDQPAEQEQDDKAAKVQEAIKHTGEKYRDAFEKMKGKD